MKGILYDYFLFSRSRLIGTAVFFAVGTLVCGLALGYFGDTPLAYPFRVTVPLFGAALVTIAVGGETKYLERLVKTRFLDHILASRVTAGLFSLAIPLMNLLSLAFGAALSLLMFAILAILGIAGISGIYLASAGALSLLIAAGELLVCFAALLLRSAEKGELAVALVILLGVVLPLDLLTGGAISVDVTDPATWEVAAAVGAALYPIGSFLIFYRVKRGELC